jgi:rare lipoprotein A
MKTFILICIAFLMIAATKSQDSTATQIDTTIKKTEIKTSETKKENATITGIASFYSDYFEGRKTANGETFRQSGTTCASNNIALGTWIKVTNLSNNKTIVVKVNDRMAPSMAKKGRVVDMTRHGANVLGFVSKGLTKVKVEILGKKKP